MLAITPYGNLLQMTAVDLGVRYELSASFPSWELASGWVLNSKEPRRRGCVWGVGTYNRMINVICRDMQGKAAKMLICSIPDESQSFQLSVSSSILETLGI